jgi:hypothetical protein
MLGFHHQNMAPLSTMVGEFSQSHRSDGRSDGMIGQEHFISGRGAARIRNRARNLRLGLRAAHVVFGVRQARPKREERFPSVVLVRPPWRLRHIEVVEVNLVDVVLVVPAPFNIKTAEQKRLKLRLSRVS